MQEIEIIISGPGNVRALNQACKFYARSGKLCKEHYQVNVISQPAKEAHRKGFSITFTDEEACITHHPHDDVITITILIANIRLHKLLVNNESSVNVLYTTTYDKLNFG